MRKGTGPGNVSYRCWLGLKGDYRNLYHLVNAVRGEVFTHSRRMHESWFVVLACVFVWWSSAVVPLTEACTWTSPILPSVPSTGCPSTAQGRCTRLTSLLRMSLWWGRPLPARWEESSSALKASLTPEAFRNGPLGLGHCIHFCVFQQVDPLSSHASSSVRLTTGTWAKY